MMFEVVITEYGVRMGIICLICLYHFFVMVKTVLNTQRRQELCDKLLRLSKISKKKRNEPGVLL